MAIDTTKTWQEQNIIDRANYQAAMLAKQGTIECRRLTCKKDGYSTIGGELLCKEHFYQDVATMSADGP